MGRETRELGREARELGYRPLLVPRRPWVGGGRREGYGNRGRVDSLRDRQGAGRASEQDCGNNSGRECETKGDDAGRRPDVHAGNGAQRSGAVRGPMADGGVACSAGGSGGSSRAFARTASRRRLDRWRHIHPGGWRECKLHRPLERCCLESARRRHQRIGELHRNPSGWEHRCGRRIHIGGRFPGRSSRPMGWEDVAGARVRPLRFRQRDCRPPERRHRRGGRLRRSRR